MSSIVAFFQPKFFGNRNPISNTTTTTTNKQTENLTVLATGTCGSPESGPGYSNCSLPLTQLGALEERLIVVGKT